MNLFRKGGRGTQKLLYNLIVYVQIYINFFLMPGGNPRDGIFVSPGYCHTAITCMIFCVQCERGLISYWAGLQLIRALFGSDHLRGKIPREIVIHSLGLCGNAAMSWVLRRGLTGRQPWGIGEEGAGCSSIQNRIYWDGVVVINSKFGYSVQCLFLP